MKWHMSQKPSSLGSGERCALCSVRAQRQKEDIQAQMYTKADTTAEKKGKKMLAREQVFLIVFPLTEPKEK